MAARVAGWVVTVAAVECLTGLMAPGGAHACSPAYCLKGRFLPLSGGTVPANAPALLWLPPYDRSAKAGSALPPLQLSRIDGPETPVPVTLVPLEEPWVAIVPESLIEGASYRLEAAGECEVPKSEFTVGEPAPLPSSLGATVVGPVLHGPLSVSTSRGSCVADVSTVYVEPSVELSAEALPWADLLRYATYVDGEPWEPSWGPSALWPPYQYRFERSEDIVYADCQVVERDTERSPLQEGAHDVRIVARLCGVDLAEDDIGSESAAAWLSCRRPGIDQRPNDNARSSTYVGSTDGTDGTDGHDASPEPTFDRGSSGGGGAGEMDSADRASSCAAAPAPGRGTWSPSAWLVGLAILRLAARARTRRRVPGG